MAAQAGKKNRSTGATAMNQESSRSHSIFTIYVECISKTAMVRFYNIAIKCLTGCTVALYASVCTQHA